MIEVGLDLGPLRFTVALERRRRQPRLVAWGGRPGSDRYIGSEDDRFYVRLSRAEGLEKVRLLQERLNSRRLNALRMLDERQEFQTWVNTVDGEWVMSTECAWWAR